MKKIVLIIIFVLFFTTGCTCEYNLVIEDGTYYEKIKIIAENENEITDLDVDWKIPTDKDEYNIGGDSSTELKYDSDLYDYKLNNNILTISYDFTKSKYNKSSAVSECYDKFNVTSYNNAIIISTSLKAKCFEIHPGLNGIKVSIRSDMEVISSNADNESGELHTWYIDKNNYRNRPINLTLSKKSPDITITPSSSSISNNNNIDDNNNNNDYIWYIFLGIVIIMIIVGYLLFNRMKEKNNQVDD